MRAVGALFALTLFCAGPLRAISVVPPTFPELVDLATEIVRVEVLDVSSRFDNGSADSPIHTYVRCRVLRAMKGDAAESITLRLLGGQVGNVAMAVPDMPAFVAGEKYIFFVAQNGRAFCPLVGVMHGTYPIVADATTAATERVLRNNREPLLDVAAVVRPMADQISTRAIASPSALSSALSVEDFEAAIVREMANAKRR